MTRYFRSSIVGVTIAGALVVMLSASIAGQERRADTRRPVDRFTAFVANLSGFGRPTAETVQISIDRWSTPAEREQLRAELIENGQDGLLRALRKLPRVGYIGTPGSLGWDLHYASEVQSGTTRRILIATDRPVSFWEAANRPRTIDYPFTVIEMRMGPNGKGEGKLTLATKATWNQDEKVVELEDYASQPAQLLNITEEK